MGRLTPRQIARLDAANQARFAAETELLLPAVRAALGMYLAALNRRVDQSAFGLNAPPPAIVAAAPIEAPTSDNPHHFTTTDAVQLQAVFDHAAPEWVAAMDTTLMPGMRTMLARIPIPVEHPTVAKAVEVWRSEWLAERTQILVGVPDTITSEIRLELDRLATEHGTSVFDAKTAVKDLLSPDRLDWEAQRIARTEVVSANNSSALASWRSLIGTLGGGVRATKTWIGGQRPTHSAVSGTTIGIDEKFHVGDSEMDGPGDSVGGPGETVNCVVGSTRVEMPGLRAVTRRWFEGDVVTLCTASGNELTVTPNHPVLRADGRWIAAALVQEGDYLISGSLSGRSVGAPDVDARPPEIAEVYRAAHLASPPKRVALAAPDFHGDGTDGEVEVVAVDGRLLLDGEAATEEQITEFGLALADHAAAAVRRVHGSEVPTRLSAGVVHRCGTSSAAGRISSRSARPTLSDGDLSHPDQHGVGCATGFHPSEKQPLPDSGSRDAEGRSEGFLRLSGAVAGGHLGVGHDAPRADRWPHFTGSEDRLPHAVHADASICGDLMQTFTGTVAADKVRFVSRSNFAGHVYNLDTGSGWYIGQSLLQRNCACSLSFEIDDSPASGSSDGSDQTATVTASAAPDLHQQAQAAVTAQFLTAAGDTPNTGACLMAYLSSEDAARLAVPGGEPPENLHVTLAYLDRPASDFPPDEQAEIDAAFAAAWVGPITADAFGTALFNPDSEERDPCAVLLVQSDDLSNARDALISALDTVPIGSPVGLDKTFPIWIPHVSLLYIVQSKDAPRDTSTTTSGPSLQADGGGDPHTHGVPNLIENAEQDPAPRDAGAGTHASFGVPGSRGSSVGPDDRGGRGRAPQVRDTALRESGMPGSQDSGLTLSRSRDKADAGRVLGAQGAIRQTGPPGLGNVQPVPGGSGAEIQGRAPGSGRGIRAIGGGKSLTASSAETVPLDTGVQSQGSALPADAPGQTADIFAQLAGKTGPLTFNRLVMAWGDDKHDLTNGAATADSDLGPGQVLTAATQEQPMTAPTDTPPAPVADPTAEPTGPTWSGPLALLGVPSSDNRKLGLNGTVRPLPQPLNWQHKSAQRHEGSSVVGRILTVEIRDGMIWGTGDWLPGWNEDVDKARQQVDGGLGLVSVDTVPGVVSFEDKTGNPIDPNTYTGDFDDVIVVFDEWELGGVTIVSFPAFADARIATDPGTETDTDDLVGGPLIMPGQTETFAGENPAAPTVSDDGTTVTLPDGSVVSIGDPVTFPGEDGADTAGTITGIDPAGLTVTVALTPDGDADADDQAEPVTVTVPIGDLTPAGPPIDGTPAAAPAFAADTEVDALLASSTAHPYPASAFAKRELLGPTPLTLNRETNEVYGHFATRDTCHMGKLAQDGVCVTAPESPTGYDYFHLGEIITDQGPLPVGKITVGGGHAGPRVGFRGAVEHYDRTCAQVAVVRAYDDAYGGQFTGMLIPGVSDEKVEEMMRAGQLSGDWRMMKGNLELVAALAVNVPGFPVKRPTPKYGMIGDRQVSLVAAGMVIPEENIDVVLPSGQTLPRSDWDALVAATFTAIQQHTAAARTPAPEVQTLPVVDQLALRRATARLALLDSEAV